MKKTITLREHLAKIDQNSEATPETIERMVINLKKKFKKCGYPKAAKNTELLKEYIALIFSTQDNRCTHWLPVKKGQINGVWNRPGRSYCCWKTDRVIYEIDHVNPTNAGGKDELTNYQFLSSNANQFTKCSLPYDLLLTRIDLSSALKLRIKEVLRRREALFKSDKWTAFLKKLDNWEKGAA